VIFTTHRHCDPERWQETFKLDTRFVRSKSCMCFGGILSSVVFDLAAGRKISFICFVMDYSLNGLPSLSLSLRSTSCRRGRLHELTPCRSKARCFAVARPKLSGRRSSSTVLNQFCLCLVYRFCITILRGPASLKSSRMVLTGVGTTKVAKERQAPQSYIETILEVKFPADCTFRSWMLLLEFLVAYRPFDVIILL